MIQTLPGVANTVDADLVAVDGTAITSGDVNFYLIALTGTNAGKWFKTSDSSWSATEEVAAVGAHKAAGHWTASIIAAAWVSETRYQKYATESGSLDIPVSEEVLCRAAPALPGAQMDLVDAPNATATSALGTAAWATTGRTLTAATNITDTGGTITVSGGKVGVYTGSQAYYAQFFTLDSGKTRAADAVAGSVVKETATAQSYTLTMYSWEVDT